MRSPEIPHGVTHRSFQDRMHSARIHDLVPQRLDSFRAMTKKSQHSLQHSWSPDQRPQSPATRHRLSKQPWPCLITVTRPVTRRPEIAMPAT